MRKLTIAFPIYNEGSLAREFIEAVDAVCETLQDYQVDLFIVNDGSTDSTLSHIEEASFNFIQHISVVNLARNAGPLYAVQCAIDHVSGPITIMMDADFQDDPQDILRLIKKHEETGADVIRVARSDQMGNAFDKFLYNGFRRLYRLLTHEKYSFGTFGLYSSKAIKNLRSFGSEAHRYLPGLVSLVGLKSIAIASPRSLRRQGGSKMGKKRQFRLAFDAFFSFSALPIRLASIFGFFITLIGLIAILVIVYVRLFTTLAISGWSSILTAITFFGGIQLLFLGLLGEYIARIFEQVKNRPHYFIDSTLTLSRRAHAPASR